MVIPGGAMIWSNNYARPESSLKRLDRVSQTSITNWILDIFLCFRKISTVRIVASLSVNNHLFWHHHQPCAMVSMRFCNATQGYPPKRGRADPVWVKHDLSKFRQMLLIDWNTVSFLISTGIAWEPLSAPTWRHTVLLSLSIWRKSYLWWTS